MTDAEIRQAEIVARSHLDRIRTLEARMVGKSTNGSGVVPSLCELILALTAELKQRSKGKAA